MAQALNDPLFNKAVAVAQNAAALSRKADFIVAVRVAQAMSLEQPRLVRLLERAIEEFPSPKAERITTIVARFAQTAE